MIIVNPIIKLSIIKLSVLKEGMLETPGLGIDDRDRDREQAFVGNWIFQPLTLQVIG